MNLESAVSSGKESVRASTLTVLIAACIPGFAHYLWLLSFASHIDWLGCPAGKYPLIERISWFFRGPGSIVPLATSFCALAARGSRVKWTRRTGVLELVSCVVFILGIGNWFHRRGELGAIFVLVCLARIGLSVPIVLIAFESIANRLRKLFRLGDRDIDSTMYYYWIIAFGFFDPDSHS